MIDLTSGIDLSSTSIEQLAATNRPEFLQIRDEKVEFARGFPNMMLTLWTFIVVNRRIPTQKQFVDYFIQIHGTFCTAFNIDSVRARVLRTYPSIIRDLHFYSLVKESGIFKNVTYDAHKDTQRGIDLIVGLGEQEYNICCYVATRRSQEFRNEKKTHRHVVEPNTIELPLDLNGGRDVNGWKFFDTIHIHNMQTEIMNYAWTTYNEHPFDLLL